MKLQFDILLCISASVLLLSGCANSYYCTLNSRGVSPAVKTYYVVPQDSTLKYSLEFKEYAEILKEHLNSSGYEEAYSKTAALRIELGYGMKDAYLESSSTSSGIVTNTYNNVNINSKSTSNASANLSALKYGNYSVTYNVPIGTNQGTTTVTRQESTNIGPGITTYGTASESTTHTYKIPLFVVIRAFERLTNSKDSLIQMTLFNFEQYNDEDPTDEIIKTFNNYIENNNSKLFRASELLKKDEN